MKTVFAGPAKSPHVPDLLDPADKPPLGFPPEAAMEGAILGWTLVEIEERLGYRRYLAALWELICTEYADESLTLERAARRCGISRGRLNARRGEAMGWSFHELLTRYRLLRAVELMLGRDDSLVKIAQSTGFNHVSNLSRHFKRVVGHCPGACRRGRHPSR
jgi:AraC-like DNA-binding protein